MKILKKIGDFLRPKIQKLKLFLEQTFYTVKTKTKPFIMRNLDKINSFVLKQADTIKSGAVKTTDFIIRNLREFRHEINYRYNSLKYSINTFKEWILPPLRMFYSDMRWRYHRAYIKFHLTKRLEKEVKRIGVSESLGILKGV